MSGFNKQEQIYLGSDTAFDYQLKQDKANADLSNVTRMVLILGGVTMDSALLSAGVGAHFDWTIGDGKVRFKLDDQPIPPGIYNNGRLILYDSSNADGAVWSSTLSFRVHAAV